jgi:regulatory protein
MSSQRRRARKATQDGAEQSWGPTPGSPADAIGDADPVEVAKSIVLTQLSIAPRTRVQLERVLAKRQVPDEAAAAALDRFSELGYIDDDQFAQQWVESRHSGRGLGRRALQHELRSRGVADETVKEAVEGLDPDVERATARRLVERKLPSTRGLPAANRINRLAGMLARKGYAAGLALSVVREALADEQSTDHRTLDGLLDLEVTQTSLD